MTDMPFRIYHNKRCSKSRAACQLIAESGVPAEIIDYLTTPPSREELRALLSKLGLQAHELVRRGESVFREQLRGTLPEQRGMAGRAGRAPDPDRAPDCRAWRQGGARTAARESAGTVGVVEPPGPASRSLEPAAGFLD